MSFRDDALAGQHIVISGGCGGIGVGVVKKLTDHGARLTVNDLLEPEVAISRLSEAGVRTTAVNYFKGDMTKASDVEYLVKVGHEKFGPIHTALCHVGMVRSSPLIEWDEAAWDQLMSVNVKSAWL